MITHNKVTPSEKCFTLLRHFEGCKLKSYQDSAGIWTLGYGNTFHLNGNTVKKGETITQEQADALLHLIVDKFTISVVAALKRNVQQHELDALVCLCYNIGIGNFEKSTLLKNVNKNLPVGDVVTEFLKWNKSKGKVLAGLTRRRKAEAYLYEFGIVKTDF